MKREQSDSTTKLASCREIRQTHRIERWSSIAGGRRVMIWKQNCQRRMTSYQGSKSLSLQQLWAVHGLVKGWTKPWKRFERRILSERSISQESYSGAVNWNRSLAGIPSRSLLYIRSGHLETQSQRDKELEFSDNVPGSIDMKQLRTEASLPRCLETQPRQLYAAAGSWRVRVRRRLDWCRQVCKRCSCRISNSPSRQLDICLDGGGITPQPQSMLCSRRGNSRIPISFEDN